MNHIIYSSAEPERVIEYEEISLKLTKRCNLNCVHCCESAVGLNHNELEVTTSDWKNIIDCILLSAILPNADEIEREFEKMCEELNVRPLVRQLSLSGNALENEDRLQKAFDNYLEKYSIEKYKEEDRIVAQYASKLLL